jgi:hypothetical protein
VLFIINREPPSDSLVNNSQVAIKTSRLKWHKQTDNIIMTDHTRERHWWFCCNYHKV